jgi:hypothetical protein
MIMMMMTLGEVKKCLDKWGIKHNDEFFFNDCSCVSFIPTDQNKGLKVYVFRNELWVFFNHENKRENFVKTHSFNDEEKLGTVLQKSLGLSLQDDPTPLKVSRCLWFGCM